MKGLLSEQRGCMRWITVMLLLFIFIGMVPVTAGELPDCKHVYINVANDNGPRFSDHENGSYYLKFDGGGLNALHLTTDAAYPYGQVTTSPDQSGVFYIADTGGRGYSDNTILMLAVNGTIPDDFSMKVRASGYTWEPVTVKNTLPALEDLKHIDGTMEETFTKEDFIYGPQTWKPAGNNLPMAYPIYFGQDTSDTGNPFHLMFIDLKAGPVSKATGLVDRNDLTDGGAVKVEYSFENLETFAAFNAYVWCNQSNQGQGISWTNRVSGTESSVYQVVGIPPELTTISVSPVTAEVDVGESLQFAATALDQRDRSMDGVTFQWTSSDETVGTVNETGSFTALAAGTTTITAANGTVKGTAEVTVTAAPSGPQPLPDYNHIFFKVANDAGVKYDAFGNQTYNVRFEGINRGLNALHISTDPAVNFGQVTVTENQSGTFYATDSGGKGYEDEIILLVAVNGSIPQDLRLHVKADGYSWTPNPVSNQPPPLDTATYQSSALDEVFTTEDFIYGPQIWKPTGNECDYPLYAGQDMEDKENTFHLMFIDLNAGVLRPNADLENRGAVRINYTFENLDTFAAFSVYGYCKNSKNGDDMVAWSNALLPDKTMSGYSVIGTGAAGPDPARIEVTPATASHITVGEDRQFAATAFDTDGSEMTGLTFTWSSSNETVGTVDTSGSFAALAAGTTTLSAAYGGVAGQAEVTVGTAAPQTWYVGDDAGSDYSTIQAAVDAAKAGDTIVVKNGTYNENVDVTRSLIIRSEHGAAHTTLTSANRDSGFDITADNVTLEGFTVTGVNGRGNFGIYVHGAEGAVISGNTVENCRECLKIESSSGNTVQNNVLSVSNNAANNVFWLADASDNLIYLNDFNLGAVTVEGTSSGNIWSSPLKIRYSLDGTVHIGTLGNHWNGYTGADTNSDGIGEDPYTITDDNTDASPLVRPQADYVTDDLPEGIVITIDPLNPWIKSGETLGFTASAVDAEGKPIEDAAFVWSSSNTTVGTIGTDGVFTAAAPGVTTISASCGGATASTDLTVVRTRYVDASGGADFTTIQAAVDAACNGDTIVVRDGTYNESVAVTKSLVIRSENGPGNTVVQGVTSDGAVFSVEADDTTISGLTLAGTGSAGIFCGDHSGCTFSETVCSGDSGLKKGIWALRGNRIEVENNTLSQLFTGVLFADCSNSIIRNNTCSDNQNGIEVSKTSGQKEQNNTVSSNLITGNSYGVGLSSVSGCHVTRNTIRENDCALQISFASENNEIYANTIVNNTGLFWVDLNAPNLWNSPEAVTYIYNGATYTGLVGNYWGGAFPVHDADKNGIADSALTLFAGNVDNAPLMMPVPAYSGGSCDGIPVPTSIALTPSSYIVPEEGEQEFTATVYDQNGKEMSGIGFEWTSSNETVGTFAQEATFTALFPGETTVLVKSHSLEATAEVTVNQTSVRTIWTDPCESTDGWTLNNAGLIDSVVYTGSHSIGVEPCQADSSAERTIDFSEGCTELSFRMYNDRLSGGAGIQSTIKVFLDGEMMKEIKSQFTRSQWYTYSFDISGYEPGPHTLKVESHFAGKSNQGAGYYIDQIKLRVEMPEASAITLSPATADLKAGEGQQFTATAYNETGEELTGLSFVWSSSNPDVGSVDADGFFTALSEGTTTITAAYGGMSGESTVSVTVPHGDQRKKASLDVPGCEIATGDEGQQKIRINASESGASVEGDLIQIKKETCTLNVRTRGAPSVENGTVNGDVSGIVLETNPIITTLDAVGTVSASLAANLTGLPAGAALETTVSQNVSAAARSAFQLAATADGLNLGAIAYTMNIEKINLANGEDISNATITMAVSPAWVEAHGGVDAVRIIRSAEDGTKEVLKTVLVGIDADGNMVFEAFSPKGLSAFGLTAVTKATEPPASSSSSSDGSSNVAAISGSIPAGESHTFVVSETAVQRITVEAYDTIDDLLVTVQKASLPKDIPTPESPTYQIIETDLYHTDASAIDMVTLEFAVPTTWLKAHGLSTEKIILLQYKDDAWKPLKTTCVKEENGQALYSAEASGFSYFAIATGETASAAAQAGETETPTPAVTDAPATVEETTVPATTPTTQKSPVPWFLSLVAISALFLLKRD